MTSCLIESTWLPDLSVFWIQLMYERVGFRFAAVDTEPLQYAKPVLKECIPALNIIIFFLSYLGTYVVSTFNTPLLEHGGSPVGYKLFLTFLRQYNVWGGGL